MFDLPNDATLHYYLSELTEESVSDLTANEIDRYLRFAESLCAASRDHISPENQLAINSLLRAARFHRGLDVNTYVDLMAATGSNIASLNQKAGISVSIVRANKKLPIPSGPISHRLELVESAEDEDDMPFYSLD